METSGSKGNVGRALWTGAAPPYRKGHSILFLLERLRQGGGGHWPSFNGLVCWARSISELALPISSVPGCSLDSVEEVWDRRMVAQLSSMLENMSHPLPGHSAPPMTDCYTRAVWRRYYRSFLPVAVRLYDKHRSIPGDIPSAPYLFFFFSILLYISAHINTRDQALTKCLAEMSPFWGPEFTDYSSGYGLVYTLNNNVVKITPHAVFSPVRRYHSGWCEWGGLSVKHAHNNPSVCDQHYQEITLTAAGAILSY